jgi:hypothetical protein
MPQSIPQVRGGEGRTGGVCGIVEVVQWICEPQALGYGVMTPGEKRASVISQTKNATSWPVGMPDAAAEARSKKEQRAELRGSDQWQ